MNHEINSEISALLGEISLRDNITTVSFSINIEDAYNNKKSDLVIKAFKRGFGEFVKFLKKNGVIPLESKELDIVSGYYFIFSTGFNAFYLKKLCVEFEENHIFGRLFNIEVMSSEGLFIKREDLGFEKRKCLICKEKHDNNKHLPDEIINYMDMILKKFIQAP